MFSLVRRSFQDIFGRSGGRSLKGKALCMQEIYRSLDRDIAVFRALSGIKCPKDCGECCFHSTVEASELEMLPLALVLVRARKAEEWHDHAKERDFQGRCVLYSADHAHGRCLYYAFRPLVCRLFGYAGNRDKHGRPRLVTCSVLKKVQPQETENALERVLKGGLSVPIMSDVVMRMSSIDPEMTREIMPVNLALGKAVERVGINIRYS